ncbi:hypothetical protein [Hymenobacter sp. UYP22]|uniref:hypothetical protein n=1 Tax=Hymenobacter sp. UYP22 TaxID=3156348 RepID=UPI00339342AA
MKELLRRVRLITPIVLELPVDKDLFIQRLKSHVAPPHINPASWLGRIFSPTVAPYTGVVEADFVRLKPRAPGNRALATMEATVSPVKAGVRLTGELNGISTYLAFSVAVCVGSSLLMLVFMALLGSELTFATLLASLCMLLMNGIVFIGIPYTRARRQMQQTAYELERDLFYFVQRPEPAPPH